MVLSLSEVKDVFLTLVVLLFRELVVVVLVQTYIILLRLLAALVVVEMVELLMKMGVMTWMEM
jgi:hypothetical protein